MDAAFQAAQNGTFDTVLAVFGVPCTWIGGNITDKVLFNNPTVNQRFNVISGRGLNHVGYDNADILQPFIEFRSGQYNGLWQLVYGVPDDAPNQYVQVNGQKYVCVKSTAFFDGQTYRIGLQTATTDQILPGL